MAEKQEKGLITGWALGLASACVFLLPLIAALVGIVLALKLGVAELLGAVVGFALGLLLAVSMQFFFVSNRKVSK